MAGFEAGNRIIGSKNKNMPGKDAVLLWTSERGGIEVEIRGLKAFNAMRVSVSNSATKLPPNDNSQRKSIGLYVPSGGPFYVGGPGVDDLENGFPLLEGYYFFDGETSIYGYATSGIYINVLEGF